jgi:hypothetical protein
MNNFTYLVKNADIPLTYIRASVDIHVKYAIRHSVIRAVS